MPKLPSNPDYELPKSEAEKTGGKQPVTFTLINGTMIAWLWRKIRGK